MGARRKRSGGKRPSGEARLARLASAGLVKKRDFKRSSGKLTRASSEKLRQLDKKLGKYLRSPDFAMYTPKSASERRKLLHVLPQELRNLRLGAVPIRVERSTRTGKSATNKLLRVRIHKDGTVRVDTNFSSYLYPKLSRDELLNPELSARRLKKFKGKNRSIRVLTGIGTLNRMHPIPDAQTAVVATREAVESFRAYSRDMRPGEAPCDGEPAQVRGVDFVEGLMVEIRRPLRAKPRETERRKRTKGSRSRGKAKVNRSNRR